MPIVSAQFRSLLSTRWSCYFVGDADRGQDSVASSPAAPLHQLASHLSCIITALALVLALVLLLLLLLLAIVVITLSRLLMMVAVMR